MRGAPMRSAPMRGAPMRAPHALPRRAHLDASPVAHSASPPPHSAHRRRLITQKETSSRPFWESQPGAAQVPRSEMLLSSVTTRQSSLCLAVARVYDVAYRGRRPPRRRRVGACAAALQEQVRQRSAGTADRHAPPTQPPTPARLSVLILCAAGFRCRLRPKTGSSVARALARPRQKT